MTPRRMHRSATMALSALMVLLGLALVGEDLAGGDVISPRLLLGALFLAAGLGRLYVEVRRGRQA
jgi:hypothetical protein